ncbi:MAG: hypothetical protein R6X11_06555 [Desulfonatronovibrio sp.]
MIGLFRKKRPYSEQAQFLEKYLSAYRQNIHLPATLRVSELESMHCSFCSSLHRRAQAREPDVSAFLYAALRLPDCVSHAGRVLLGPAEDVFAKAGFPGVEGWIQVKSRARRRRYHYDGDQTLAVFVTSVTDLDDLIPSLCAFQIEWNKMHRLLNPGSPDFTLGRALAAGQTNAAKAGQEIRRSLGLARSDWELLTQVWADDWDRKWSDVAGAPLDLVVYRLPLHDGYFEKAAQQWWDMVSCRVDLESASSGGRPLYLVSSNTHSLANLITGFARTHETELLTFLERENQEDLWRVWQDCQRDPEQNPADLLYYGLRLYEERYPSQVSARLIREESMGFHRHAPVQYPHLEVQRIALSRLDPSCLDSRLQWAPSLARSQALLVNIDYPLGLAAGHVLASACERFPGLRGVFILGKSAAAIGRLGDIIIPSHVYDSHTQTRYLFQNSLNVRHLVPFLNRIAAFDDQKTITAHGTFLHGREVVSHLLQDDFTGVEMEAGPFLRALHRHFSRQELVQCMGNRGVLNIKTPQDFNLGILHYTSDTPYNIRPSLLSTRLGMTGLEAVYASSLAILQRIMDLEAKKL